jgi:hypothetical protein
MTPYEKMRKREAAAALQEFLQERPRALQDLADSMARHGADPGILDGSVESLVPLWRWVKSVLSERSAGADGPELSPPDGPTWLRHGIGIEPTLSPESVALVDGVISYVCQVIERGVPQAQWRVGEHRVRSYIWRNHPVLGVDEEEVAPASLVPGAARGHVSGRVPSEDDALAVAAAAVVERLGGPAEEPAAGADQPLVEVEDLGDDPVRGRELEVSLREDVAHEHSGVVDALVESLAGQDGVGGAVREDREVVLVRTEWDAARLQRWVSEYLRAHVR